MTLSANIDGASRGNPGESGLAVIIRHQKKGIVFAAGEYLGTRTNNQAEYSALRRCLDYVTTITDKTFRECVIYSDSELVIKQMNGEYAVKDPVIKQHWTAANDAVVGLQGRGIRIRFEHVPRDQNGEADGLANQAIDLRLQWPS